MPKVIELTIQVDVQKVSCPGVWLCQSGRVSLIVFALGTSYQTCMLPPVFPLMFKDVFYFQKRFRETCALNNICCLLKNETIYCELVQWADSCDSDKCMLLAQYLGALNDILFPPNTCSTDGVDLLMRRTKGFPGILSPKIEISTKVRIDEILNQKNKVTSGPVCNCETVPDSDGSRQKPVCHSPLYHRARCYGRGPFTNVRSRSRSIETKSCASFQPKESGYVSNIYLPDRRFRGHSRSPRRSPGRARRPYHVYNVEASATPWQPASPANDDNKDEYDDIDSRTSDHNLKLEPVNALLPEEERIQRLLVESRYIEEPRGARARPHRPLPRQPCVCDICLRYHQLFHSDSGDS
ncbi:PREDICTED: spermatogenesis-associated protein 6 isoform X1 [Papilio polytes]|uniref:spermatogenesis-associated protein 6 isoform X1 n=1 Tax=Papilio polytes TaxID=76194 RepID=UPI000675FE32|nr:PREDICTED: spermatogenesis-associated protein 6 isoform X1 [Papilio polytes]